MIFAPQTVGAYVAQLHITVQPLVSDQHPMPALDRLPSMVTLQAIAEKPLVQVTLSTTSTVWYSCVQETWSK